MKSFDVVNEALRNFLFYEQGQPSFDAKMFCSEQISKQTRQLISIEDLRDTGSFFTGDELAASALLKLAMSISNESKILDPSCGIGNLLISAAQFLPVFSCLDQTMKYWGERLYGYDLHVEFIDCTKLRLIQDAINRGAINKGQSLRTLESRLENIRTGNIFHNLETCREVTHILMNPPFTMGTVREQKSWGGGKLNMAAVFVEDVLENSTNDTHFVAILPDVLRSGTRYETWRNIILSTHDVTVEISGRFDSSTNVDVFMLSGTTGKPSKSLMTFNKSLDCEILDDYFDVCVGPVVKFRDKEIGEIVPFVQTKALTLWEEIEPFETRRTETRLFTPPFVVVNRTSSPSDTHRARASIVVDDNDVAVENHLIVLSPKNGNREICRELVALLKSPKTNEFLNTRIRCRHLTVSAVREIPW